MNEIDSLVEKELTVRKAKVLFSLPQQLETTSGDIHNLPFSERIKLLDKIKVSEHVKRTKRILCHSEAEVRKAIEKTSDEPGSEGSYLKLSTFPYNLTGRTNQNIKYKRELTVEVQILKVNIVKEAKR